MSWNPEDVVSSPDSAAPNLQKTLALSSELEAAIWDLLDPPNYELGSDEPRAIACFETSQLAMEHGQALRGLISAGFDSTAMAVLRVQFEALTRAHWALYAASGEQLEAMLASIGEQAAKGAADLPMAAAMVKALAGKGPPGMQEMFAGFQSIVMKELHAFVHAGAPSVRLHNDGYPSHVLDRLVRQSNAMQIMAGMTLANLSGDAELSRAMSKIAMPFEACLPHLLRQPPGLPSQPAPVPRT
jgi:hypothetical protein